jgi:hypothetical protein
VAWGVVLKKLCEDWKFVDNNNQRPSEISEAFDFWDVELLLKKMGATGNGFITIASETCDFRLEIAFVVL